MTERHIGTCSNCGGKVMIHDGPWYGVIPPEPRCSSCGAGVRKPVMQMGKPNENVTTVITDYIKLNKPS